MAQPPRNNGKHSRPKAAATAATTPAPSQQPAKAGGEGWVEEYYVDDEATAAAAYEEISSPVEPVAVAPAPAEQVATQVAAPAAPAALAPAPALAAAFDAGLSARTMDFWSENAAAFLGFAEEFAKAKSFTEVLELQSRFFTARLESFVKQTNEIADLSRRLTVDATKPLGKGFAVFCG
jgi:hypothetical protein